MNELDETDIHILKLLQQDARLSHKELSHRLSKSITTIHVRARRLQEAGYIRKYTVLIDPKKVDRGLIGYIQVQVEKHSEESLTVFMQEAVKLAEVMESYHMTGSIDFLLRNAIRDMDEYYKVLMKKLANLPFTKIICSFRMNLKK